MSYRLAWTRYEPLRRMRKGKKGEGGKDEEEKGQQSGSAGKALTAQGWRPEFSPRDPHRHGWKKHFHEYAEGVHFPQRETPWQQLVHTGLSLSLQLWLTAVGTQYIMPELK